MHYNLSILGFPGGSVVTNSPATGAAGDSGSIPGSGRSPRGGHPNPLQYSCLENPMDREAWQATVHGVAKSWTRLKWLSTAPSEITTRLCLVPDPLKGCFCPFIEYGTPSFFPFYFPLLLCYWFLHLTKKFYLLTLLSKLLEIIFLISPTNLFCTIQRDLSMLKYINCAFD